ncbi:hypothetical protein [Sphingomonas sp.]|uniref:hypothetical protein n=1 Tax=Sphingomonas sp. TaxID=28214 RepID=UPI000BCC7B96|nr:hypothetical protein [Sphingomonas sp.]MBA4763508.1 hypothetical protein [Sphingomonas sp.]OYX49243.1 MAG: hypothetical protein B7Y97_09135 [Sphingomonas sp. 32-66-10]
MGFKAPRSPAGQRDSGYWVEAPRATDPIGFALRETYGDDRDLPSDMQELLSQLSTVKNAAGRSSHG